MKGILLRWWTLTAAIIVAGYVFDGIRIDGVVSAVMAGAILGILNALFRPIVLILTLPVNLLSLGLFTFVINAFMLKLASGVIHGFDVQGFWTSILGALVISLVSLFLNTFIGESGTVQHINRKRLR